MRGWYFAPSLNHYHVIKTFIDTGAVKLTDSFRFKNHAIKPPTVTTTGRIVKSTQSLDLTIQGKNDTPPYELEAITYLQDLILGNNKNSHTKDKTVEPANVSTPTNNANISEETTLIPNEETMDIQNTSILGLCLLSPAIISQDDVEDTPNS